MQSCDVIENIIMSEELVKACVDQQEKMIEHCDSRSIDCSVELSR